MFLTRSSVLRRWLVVAAALGGISCGNYSAISAGECGNHVVDANEDCDTYLPEAGAKCGAPTEAHACRFVCDENGAHCPTGWGCGDDGVCRQPSSQFELTDKVIPFGLAHSLRTGDFDGDGQVDVFVIGEEDGSGLHGGAFFFGSTPFGSKQLEIPSKIAAIASGDLESDGILEISFADFDGVSSLEVSKSDALSYGSFPAYFNENGSSIRYVPIEVLPAKLGNEVVVLVDQHDSGATLIRPESDQPELTLVSLPLGNDALLGEVLHASFDHAVGCEQLVLTYMGQDRLYLFTPCRNDISGIVWNDHGTLEEIRLPEGATLAQPSQIIDMNGDNRLDILIGGSTGTFVAYGNGNGQFSEHADGTGNLQTAGAFSMPEEANGPNSYPLLVADLNLDGRVDYVTFNRIVVSHGDTYVVSQTNLGSEWTTGATADLNGDGLLDVVVGSHENIDLEVFRNAGSGLFDRQTVPTSSSTGELRVGDFDGDAVDDIAVVMEFDHDGVDSDALGLVFGSKSGPLGKPQILAPDLSIEALARGRFSGASGLDAIDDLVVVATRPSDSTDLAYLFRGNGNRAIKSPLSLTSTLEVSSSVAIAIGNFGDETPELATLSMLENTDELVLGRIKVSGEFLVESLRFSPPLSPKFHPKDRNNHSLSSFDYSGWIASGDLDRDGIDEAVVIAPFGDDAMGAAWVVAKIDDSGVFAPQPEQPIEADVTVDSKLAMFDLDGDGNLDIVVTTGLYEAPGDALVVWGAGSATIDTSSVSKISLPDGVADFDCLDRINRACELVLANTRGLFLLKASSLREFEITPAVEPPGAYGVSVNDFDGDGLVDMAVLSEEGVRVVRRVPVRE